MSLNKKFKRQKAINLGNSNFKVVLNHVKLMRAINSRRGFSKGTVLHADAFFRSQGDINRHHC